ncbi:MAG: hypothetical protein JRG91_05155 [Deltaproteobacteria bacterium]|nr:hypothetical protein [Deltaproteobacteria bacterium]
MPRRAKHTLRCSNCGVNLPLEVGQKVVVCEYCSTHTAVPEEFWRPEPAPPAVQHQPVYSSHRLHVGSAPGTPRRSGKCPALVIAMGIALLSAGVGIFFFLGPGGTGAFDNSVRGDAAGLVDGSAVVPSFEAVDGLETAKSISAQVEKNWRPHARTSVVRFNKVSADGTLNISGDDESMISMTFYDTALLEKLVPGQTSVKGAKLTLSVIHDYIGGFATDATVTWIKDIVYVDAFPSCDLETLRKKASQAGYPDTGYASVVFPDVPGELTRDGLDFALSFVRGDGDDLKEKLEGMEWDTGPYHYYQFSVPNFDASGLPRHFSPDDCSPVDVKKLQEELIDELRKN